MADGASPAKPRQRKSVSWGMADSVHTDADGTQRHVRRRVSSFEEEKESRPASKIELAREAMKRRRAARARMIRWKYYTMSAGLIAVGLGLVLTFAQSPLERYVGVGLVLTTWAFVHFA